MKRNAKIDTLRGVACLLLVAYHVIGGNPQSGLALPAGDDIQEFSRILPYLFLPLFTFLAGIVYAWRPVHPGVGSHFVANKLRRLYLPFVAVSILFAILQKLTPGTNAKLEWLEIPLVLIWPYAHLWFIAALLLVFAFVGLLDYWNALQKPLHVVVLFGAACILFELRYGAAGLFGWNRALYLMPFFVTGVLAHRFGWEWVALCALLGLASPGWEVSGGVALSLLLLAVAPSVGFLAKIGVYSYSIYLLHVFGGAASRIGLLSLGVESIWILLPAGVIAGIAVPIAIHAVLQKVPYIGELFLGTSSKERSSKPGRIHPRARKIVARILSRHRMWRIWRRENK